MSQAETSDIKDKDRIKKYRDLEKCYNEQELTFDFDIPNIDFEVSSNDEELNKTYNDHFMTEEQKQRDKKITELLTEYTDTYKCKSKSNKTYKCWIFWLCYGVVGIFSGSLVYIGYKINFMDKSLSTENLIAFIGTCLTFITLIIGLLKTIVEYIFPQNEEEYITRIVESIQNNDLENKRENIKSNAV